MVSSKNCQYYLKEKEIQKVISEKNLSYPEARRFVCEVLLLTCVCLVEEIDVLTEVEAV
jgi:hypothetical protein